MAAEQDTKKLYNKQADDWSRSEPVLLSDYSARPFVLDLCEPLQDMDVLDIGCGEGYVSRQIKKRGARTILGVDISEKMIDGAQREQDREPLEGVEFRATDVREFDKSTGNEYDLVVATFLFNYLSYEDTQATMEMVYHVLKPGGQFVFSVPHPLLPYLKEEAYPFYFKASGGYFSSRNELFPGEIWRRDDVAVNVQCVHKTVSDYFKGLSAAGFTLMPQVHELHITEEHIKLDQKFFEPLRDLPLHIAFKVEKPR